MNIGMKKGERMETKRVETGWIRGDRFGEREEDRPRRNSTNRFLFFAECLLCFYTT